MRHCTIIGLIILSCFYQCQQPDPKISLAEDEIFIEYLAHACFLITANETTLMVDPFADRIWLGYDFPRGIKADAVFITHPHYDHDGGIFRGMRPDWMFNTPFYQNPKHYEVGDFVVKGLVGKHCDPYGKEFRQMNTIWKIEVNGLVLAHWGDNALPSAENFKALEEVDILLIPMDGDYHILKKEEYDSVFRKLAPKMIIPMHYRIPELEKDEDSPSDLGEILPFIEQRPLISRKDGGSYLPEVEQLTSNQLIISEDDLPEKSTYFIFQHSPRVVGPADD